MKVNGIFDIENLNRTDGKFYAVDLFAGCGGLSEGFEEAGFEVIAHIEKDKWACESLRSRHLYRELKKLNKEEIYKRFLREEISREDVLEEYPEIDKTISRRVVRATFGEDDTDNIISKIDASMNFHGVSTIHVMLGGPRVSHIQLLEDQEIPRGWKTMKDTISIRIILNFWNAFNQIFLYMKMFPDCLQPGRRER